MDGRHGLVPSNFVEQVPGEKIKINACVLFRTGFSCFALILCDV